MLNKKITTITVNNKEIPILCTFNVLEHLQEEYETISKYQETTLGLLDTGERDESGNPKYKNGTISIKAVLDGATAMINEGLGVQGSEETLTREEVGVLLTGAGLTIAEASELVISELIRCITPKKEKSAQGTKTKRTFLSTLRGFFTLGKHSLGAQKKK